MTQNPTIECILAGSVQTAARPAWSGNGAFAVERSPFAGHDGFRCRRPGLDVAWRAAGTSHVVRGDALCVVWGRVRAGATAADRIAPPVDAAAVLDLVTAQGAAGLAEVKGAFGLLVVDARAARVLLAVDRFSRETAAYRHVDGVLAFSDRADAVPGHARELDPQSLYDYLYFHCVPAPATIYRGVQRLREASLVEATHGALREARHWEPDYAVHARPGLAQLSTRFRALVRAAVMEEAAHGERLGCFLSGGTDSSTVAGMLQEIAQEPVRTYSIGFDAQGYDEMEYARIAARHFRTDHHEYYVTPQDVVAAAPALARSFDQPFGNSSVLPAYFCARLAAGDGVTRMLAGDGGDELFGGNTRYRMQQLLDVYQRLPEVLRVRVLEPLAHGPLRSTRVPLVRHAAGYVRHASAAMPGRMESFNLLARVGAATILAPGVLQGVDPEWPRRQQGLTYAEGAAPHLIDRMLRYDWRYTLADSDLPKVRAATAQAGVGVGYPLLCDELVDFSLALAPRHKVRGWQLRWFFKHALRDFLPVPILRKKKHGFGLPFGPWALRHAALNELASDSLALLERRDMLRKGFRDELMRELLPAHPSYYGELVWILMMLAHWLEAHAGAPRGSVSAVAR